MNFLAHLYLSGENKDILVGNFIGDYVKGKKYLDYPETIQKGIILHRRIDHFTDTHKLTRDASVLFKPAYGRYSGIVVDIMFDHFLAKHWNHYSTYRFKDFTKKSHGILLSNFRILPKRVKQFLPILIQSKRLESYSFEHGIKRALEIMSHYTSLPDETESAIKILQNQNSELLEYFHTFMKDIIGYVERDFAIEIKKPDEIIHP